MEEFFVEEEIPYSIYKYIHLNYGDFNLNLKTRFLSYLENYNGEILQRVFAFRNNKKKGIEITEVIRRCSNNNLYMVKNLYFVNVAGYIAVYESKNIYRYGVIRWSKEDFDKWYIFDKKDKCNLFAPVINIELLQNTKYKYCGYNSLSCGYDIIDYLELYNKYPGVEFLSKMGLYPSVMLLKKCEKDKLFCKYLIKNKENVFKYNVQTVVYAFNHNLRPEDAHFELYIRKELKDYLDKNILNNINFVKMHKYFEENNISIYLYKDYLEAIIYLKLDLTQSKNLYPHDFKRMHDLRIDECDSAKAEEEIESKRKFYSDFKKVSNKYKFLEYKKDYMLEIAPSVMSLKKEGRELKHCVGKLGYDKKMIDEKSLIFFIRKLDNLKKPFVTLEYSLSEHKILQIYGYDDTDPEESVIKFANHWLKIANRRLSKFEKKVA